MRCRACDGPLTNTDTSRKSLVTGEYYDLCTPCFNTIKDQVTSTDKDVPEMKEDNEGDSHE